LFQDPRITGFACAVIAVDDGEAALAEGQSLTRHQSIDVGQTVQRSEADDGVARGRVSDMAGVQRRGFVRSFADGDKSGDFARVELDLPAEPAQRVLLPCGQIGRPSEDVGQGRGFIRNIAVLFFHPLLPPPWFIRALAPRAFLHAERL
jgi:hypothetical protein